MAGTLVTVAAGAAPARIAGTGRPALLTRTRRFVQLRPYAVAVVVLCRDCPRDRHRGRRAVLTYANGWLSLGAQKRPLAKIACGL